MSIDSCALWIILHPSPIVDMFVTGPRSLQALVRGTGQPAGLD